MDFRQIIYSKTNWILIYTEVYISLTISYDFSIKSMLKYEYWLICIFMQRDLKVSKICFKVYLFRISKLLKNYYYIPNKLLKYLTFQILWFSENKCSFCKKAWNNLFKHNSIPNPKIYLKNKKMMIFLTFGFGLDPFAK